MTTKPKEEPYGKYTGRPGILKLIYSIEHHRRHILEKVELFSGARGYEDGKLIEKL